ncbi:ATP-binding protein [Rhizobium halophilum]|uniref:ATP-binding protein n=1 Tax=Rhizobium halophilum TaxID=2846852 RepID=UPI001EFE8ED6|nr:ATP-binding protein [Rhizobium halophilum]MCF6367599.1 ATP-binding protein [Rhizobium halophilum]
MTSEEPKPLNAIFHTAAFTTPQERVAVSKLPRRQRQWMIDNLLVEYVTFKEGREFIRKAHNPYDDGAPTGGKLRALLGESRVGKSSICRYYADLNPPQVAEDQELYKVVHMTVSVRMTPLEFAQELNDVAGNRYSPMRGGWHSYVRRALLHLVEVGTELLILDDAQYLFFDRREDSIYDMFKLVKKILDTRRTNVLLVGEARTDDFIQRTPPLKNRDYSAMMFKPLTSSAKDIEDFGKLLGSIDRRLPFAEPSGLQALAEDMYRFSGGMIGIVMNIVQAAAAEALNYNRSRILIEDFRFAVKTRIAVGDDYNYFGYKSR